MPQIMQWSGKSSWFIFKLLFEGWRETVAQESCGDVCQEGDIGTSWDKYILEAFSLKYWNKKWKYSNGAWKVQLN